MSFSAAPLPLDPGLPEKLRRLYDLVRPIRARLRSAEDVADLLERDLLPRTAGGDVCVVCGIVGPNNAGKSALFNALLGRELSPSVPAGGATRRLVGGVSPGLLERLKAEPTLARFPLSCADSTAGPIGDALRPASRPAELLLVADPQLAERLMLIDTPDFDSIVEDNRVASESLLAVADVLIAVVTRHSYQNRDVVRFLQRWLNHGRPWLLVYNEAIDEQVAGAHSAKLIGQVGQRPLAVFWAVHNLAVQDGREPLLPRRLRLDGEGLVDGLGPRGSPSGVTADLRSLLYDLEQLTELKARSFSAALARLASGVEALVVDLEAGSVAAKDLLRVVDEHTRCEGERIAASAMPGGPFVDAFRTVLDRRTNPFSRGWRTLLRGARLQFEGLVAALKGGSASVAGAPEMTSLSKVEVTALRDGWPFFWEGLARDLGPEARHPARRYCASDLAALLDHELHEGRRHQAREEAAKVLGLGVGEIPAFRSVCEELIEQAMNDRGFELDIQTLADIATLAPLAVAAAVVVKTGGVGVDLAVAGGGAVSSFLMEKYSHLLGSGIVTQARRRWAVLRGARIAGILAEACLPASGAHLRSVTERNVALVGALRVARAELFGTESKESRIQNPESRIQNGDERDRSKK
jgi:hypothetical protein